MDLWKFIEIFFPFQQAIVGSKNLPGTGTVADHGHGAVPLIGDAIGFGGRGDGEFCTFCFLIDIALRRSSKLVSVSMFQRSSL